jgi:hypothetical protein
MRTPVKLMLGLALLGGCRHRAGLNVVVLVDISGSIDGNAAEMESAVDGLIDKLQDGDEVRVIPICNGGYSTVAVPLYFKVPDKREAFNEELVRSRGQIKKQVHAALGTTPCKKTAILEAIERVAKLGGYGELYVYTDGIEDSDISFYKDARLRSPEDAVSLARKLALTHQHLPGTKIRFGLLESSDFDNLPRHRRDAIVAFWRTYLSELSSDYQIEAPELLRIGN